MDTQRIIEELDAIASRVANLKLAILGPQQSAAESAESKASRGVCTYCGEPIGSKPTQRGAHSNCYRTAKRRIEQGKVTDELLVAGGLLLPPGTPGPKVADSDPVKQMQLAADKAKAAEATEALNKAAKKKGKS